MLMRWLAVENRLPRIESSDLLDLHVAPPAGCFVFRIQSTVRSRSQYSAPGQQRGGQGSGWGWLPWARGEPPITP